MWSHLLIRMHHVHLLVHPTRMGPGGKPMQDNLEGLCISSSLKMTWDSPGGTTMWLFKGTSGLLLPPQPGPRKSGESGWMGGTVQISTVYGKYTL